MAKNIHSGHRERLIEFVEKAQIENVSEIQAVEFFLTYIFPRGDVNPLAHRLLSAFGNYANILNASENELCKIEGINKRSAKKIRLAKQLHTYYNSSRLQEKLDISDNKFFFDFLEDLFRVDDTENLYLFAINNKFKIFNKRHFDLKNVREVGINPIELYDFISSAHPNYLIIAHSHPNGSAQASKTDFDAMEFIEKLLEPINDVKFLDSFVVGMDGIFSCKQKSFVRKSENMDKKYNIFG